MSNNKNDKKSNPRKRSAPTTLASDAKEPSPKKYDRKSTDKKYEKESEKMISLVQEQRPVSWKKMFDEYVVVGENCDEIVCVVDTFENTVPPQIVELRRLRASRAKRQEEYEASKNDESSSSDDKSDFLPEHPVKTEKFFSHQLCGSITPSLGDNTKIVHSLRVNADGGSGVDLKMVSMGGDNDRQVVGIGGNVSPLSWRCCVRIDLGIIT